MKNLKIIAAALFALTIIVSCTEATDTSEEVTVETPDENVDAEVIEEETPEEEVEEAPQTVEERIQEIKKLYASIQRSPSVNSNCVSKAKTTMNYDVIEEGIPFENTAKKCQLEDNLMYEQVRINGYEWSETCTFYSKNDQQFFAFLSGGAEACGYDYRVYYNRDGEVIRVLLAENDCDGQEVSEPFEVTEAKRKKEILDAIGSAEKELNSLLNEK